MLSKRLVPGAHSQQVSAIRLSIHNLPFFSLFFPCPRSPGLLGLWRALPEPSQALSLTLRCRSRSGGFFLRVRVGEDFVFELGRASRCRAAGEGGREEVVARLLSGAS